MCSGIDNKHRLVSTELGFTFPGYSHAEAFQRFTIFIVGLIALISTVSSVTKNLTRITLVFTNLISIDVGTGNFGIPTSSAIFDVRRHWYYWSFCCFWFIGRFTFPGYSVAEACQRSTISIVSVPALNSTVTSPLTNRTEITFVVTSLNGIDVSRICNVGAAVGAGP